MGASTAAFGGPLAPGCVPRGASERLRLVGDAVHVRVAPALRGRGRRGRRRGRGGRDVAQRRLAVRGLRGGRVVSQRARAAFALGAFFPRRQTSWVGGSLHDLRVSMQCLLQSSTFSRFFFF